MLFKISRCEIWGRWGGKARRERERERERERGRERERERERVQCDRRDKYTSSLPDDCLVT